MNQPLAWQTISSAIARLGSALLTTHIITSRATTPGAVTRLVNSVIGGRDDGPEDALGEQQAGADARRAPNNTATTISSAGPTPARGFATISTAPLIGPGGQQDHGLASDEVDGGAPLCRSGSAPATNQRSDGAMLR